MNKRQRKKQIKKCIVYLKNIMPIITQVPRKIMNGTNKRFKY